MTSFFLITRQLHLFLLKYINKKEGKIMLKSDIIWNSTPIIYNDQKYTYKLSSDGYIKLLNKNTNQTIFNIYSPIFIKEIRPDEFIVVYPFSEKSDYQFILTHIKNNKVVYEKQYTSKSIIGEITEINNIYIMEGFLETTLYNTINNKSLTLEDTEITEIKNKELKSTYLQGDMDVDIDLDKKDHLTMYINTSTLEFDGFYSELQDRFISIIKNKTNTFKDNLNITIEQEVLKYIEILEEYENLYHHQRIKKATQILSKKLNQKKQ